MKYLLSNTCKNTCGIDLFIAYYEIDLEGYCARSLVFSSNGSVFRYTLEHEADQFGQLPEGIFEPSEYSKSVYGSTTEITAELFNTVWAHTTSDTFLLFLQFAKPNYAIKGTAVKIQHLSDLSAAAVPYFGC